MRVLKDFLIPRIIACKQQASVTRQVLKEDDCMVRAFVRNTLHLNIYCHNSVVYTAAKDGGLGICSSVRRIFFRMQRIEADGEQQVQQPTARSNYAFIPCHAEVYQPIRLQNVAAEENVAVVCHILQACNTTHIDHINRHNTVQNIVAAHGRKQGWPVDVEKHVYGQDVSDVGIHWEGEETLQYFHDVKVNHYSSEAFIGKLRARFTQEKQ
uniref:Uncharacterized protein n=1 Tax=Glossina palpalis gambiensis TaxID=67801 RepID=A0A1B0BL80_9MUSC